MPSGAHEWKAMDLAYAVRDYVGADGKQHAVWVTCGTLWMRDGVPSQVVLDVVPVAQQDEKSGRSVVKLSAFKKDKGKPAPVAEVLNDDVPW